MTAPGMDRPASRARSLVHGDIVLPPCNTSWIRAKGVFCLTTLAWSCQSSGNGNGNLSPNCRWLSVEVPNHVGADLRDAVCRLSSFRQLHPAWSMPIPRARSVKLSSVLRKSNNYRPRRPWRPCLTRAVSGCLPTRFPCPLRSSGSCSSRPITRSPAHNFQSPELAGLKQQTLRAHLERLQPYDIVLIDCPPNLYLPLLTVPCL
jgi:hypothetical protein